MDFKKEGRAKNVKIDRLHTRSDSSVQQIFEKEKSQTMEQDNILTRKFKKNINVINKSVLTSELELLSTSEENETPDLSVIQIYKLRMSFLNR